MNLFIGFIFGTIGIYVFRHAKKEANYTLLFTALILFFYSYFIDNPIISFVIGTALTIFAYKNWR